MFRTLEEELATVIKELIDRNKGGIFYVHFCENFTANPYRVGWTLFDLVDKDKFYKSYGEKTFFTRTKAQAVANELNKKFAEDNPTQKVDVTIPAYNPNSDPLNKHDDNPENARDVIWNNDWILTTEKLPEMGECVLVTAISIDGTKNVDWDCYINNIAGWRKYPNRVIAWTPYLDTYNGSAK